MKILMKTMESTMCHSSFAVRKKASLYMKFIYLHIVFNMKENILQSLKAYRVIQIGKQ